jgi:hypothetical protein
MKKRSMAWTVTAVTLFGLAAASAGAAAVLEARAGYFFPSSADFREVYKNGLAFGADVTVPLWKSLGAWAGLDYFGKTGQLTYTQEPTTLRVLPLFAGLKLQSATGSVRPYAAVAAGYFLFKESSVIGTASGQELGLLAQIGLLFKIKARTFLDVSVRYTSCQHTVTDPEPVSVQLGGIQAAIGLAFRL